ARAERPADAARALGSGGGRAAVVAEGAQRASRCGPLREGPAARPTPGRGDGRGEARDLHAARMRGGVRARRGRPWLALLASAPPRGEASAWGGAPAWGGSRGASG